MSGLPRGVLLDLDDTILRYGAVADGLWAELSREIGPALGVTGKALLAAVDESRDRYWDDPERHRRGRLDLRVARRAIVAAAFEELGLDAPEAAEEMAERFTRVREERVELFPGAREAMSALRERRVPLALLTNGSSEFQRQKIDRFDLAPYFEGIFVEEELGFGKPDPRVFELGLEVLGIAAADAWMVGDDLERDIAPAVALGIHTVWVDSQTRGLPPSAPVRPDRVVESLHELLPR